MPHEEEMKAKLKGEIDRMNGTQLQNLTSSKNSFFNWVTSTIQRIWGAIVDTVAHHVADWLWNAFS